METPGEVPPVAGLAPIPAQTMPYHKLLRFFDNTCKRVIPVKEKPESAKISLNSPGKCRKTERFCERLRQTTAYNSHMMKTLSLCFLSLCCTAATALAVPRAEYPRPQFERNTWNNLNGEWTFTFDFSGSGLEREFFKTKGFDQKITVPFCPESKLSGVEFKDFINNMWYHRHVSIPKDWDGKKILLNFGAVYYKAEVFIDGTFAGRHIGGSSSFSVDITPFVKPGASHDLVVYATSDLRSAKQGAGKQALQYSSYGCNYTRTTGIWQTVWMEPVAPEGLQSVQIIPDIDQKQLIVRPSFYKTCGGSFRAILKEGDRVVAEQTVTASPFSTVVLPVPDMKTWSPESPFLYDTVYQVLDKTGKIVDEVKGYAGMRKIHVEGNKIYLNNKPYYQRLVLDQGFYPDGIWTAPSDEALKKDIELSKSAGFNGARLHQKVFEERFHYWADKLGYLTWGESPSWGMDANDIETARNFIPEWTEVVERDRNHPSIVVWTALNEEFWPDRIQYPRFVEDLYKFTKLADPTRPFHDASGGSHIKTDIWTVHHYEQDPAKLAKALFDGNKFFSPARHEIHLPSMNIGFNGLKFADQYTFPDYDGNMPYLVDEFGGIKWSDAPQDQKKSWGYGQAPKDLNDFYSRLEGQVNGILGLSDHVWGYCYTQLTDVEQEQNGIYKYDRTPKFDMGKIKAIFGKNPPEKQP